MAEVTGWETCLWVRHSQDALPSLTAAGVALWSWHGGQQSSPALLGSPQALAELLGYFWAGLLELLAAQGPGR